MKTAPIKSPDASLISREAASHGYDEIGAQQGSGTITSMESASGRWAGKVLVSGTVTGTLKPGQPIVVSGNANYTGNSRVLHVYKNNATGAKFILDKTYGATGQTGNWTMLGGRGAWVAFMPIGGDISASQLTSLTFHKTNEQSGTQDLDNYTQNQLYPFPGIIDEIAVSSGNLRLFRHSTIKPAGDAAS